MGDLTTGGGIGLILGPLVKLAVDAIRHWLHVDGRYVHLLTAVVSVVAAGAVVYGAPDISIRDALQIAAMIAGSTLTATGVNEVSPDAGILPAKGAGE